ncbi:SBBP repeat-containing protein [Aggregatilinea lenta]|uniref:DUF7948 domain-containing protein n=1 Tax=Aggregatilinea lenta TaxID=913108 RepID=UPI000E5A17EF|nr:SBBP repeat-containing protein [Aggregatilinea lenta]
MLKRSNRFVILVVCALVLGLASGPQLFTTATHPVSAAASSAGPNITSHTTASDTYGALPLTFEPNIGQSSTDADFIASGAGYNLALSGGQNVLVLRASGDTQPAVVTMRPIGGTMPQASAEDPQPGVTHYYTGSDPADWVTDVAHYGQVRYTDVYPGIDLLYYGNQRQLQYDFIIAPGASPDLIRLGLDGATGIRLDEGGDLLLQVGDGVLRHKAPYAYQDVNGERISVESRFVLSNDGTIGFAVGAYDTTQPLVVDPILVYSTYLGGTGSDGARAIAVDDLGNAYITGNTASADFPGAVGTPPAGQNIFVTKLSADGASILYTTIFGGAGSDNATGIAVDASGNVYVAGFTNSTDFPNTGAHQATFGGGAEDAVLVRLDNTGALTYATYLGGAGTDEATDLAFDGTAAYLTGTTTSTSFLGQTRTSSTPSDAFVVKIAPGSAPAYVTILGGSATDLGGGIAVDGSGNAYVTGSTASADFPVTVAGSTHHGAFDTFVTRLDASGTWTGAGAYSRLWGGGQDDDGYGIAVDGSGYAYVTGRTTSSDAYVPGALTYDSTSNGGYDAYLLKLSADGSTVLYNTYLGGVLDDQAEAIAVDTLQNAYIVGTTTTPGSTPSFPQKNPLELSPNVQRGGQDAFVSKFDTTLGDTQSLAESTTYGGASNDLGYGIAVDADGAMYIAGETASIQIDLLGPADATTTPPEGFVAKLSVLRQVIVTRTSNSVDVREATPSTSLDQDTYTLKLSSRPAGNVVIDLSAGAEIEISTNGATFASSATVTLTDTTWSSGVTVWVRAVDDSTIEGPHSDDITHTIDTAATDDLFDAAEFKVDALAPEAGPLALSVSITDNDEAVVNINPTAPTIAEPVGTQNITVTLGSQPATGTSVTVTFTAPASNPACEITAPGTAVLDGTNWDTGASVTVTAIDDSVINPGGVRDCLLATSLSSTDPDYSSIDPDDVTVSVTDDDGPGITVLPTIISVIEPSETATFTIRLRSQPAAPVTVPLSTSPTSACSVSPASAVISNVGTAWQTGVSVTVTAVDDDSVNTPARTCTVITGDPTSPDTNYNDLIETDAADVTVTVIDNDTAGIVVSPTDITVSESGTSSSFTVSLTSQPTDTVTIPLTASNTECATPSEVQIPAASWEAGVAVTITAVDDDIDDDDQPCTIETGDPTSADPDYNDASLNPADVSVTVEDDDEAGFTAYPPTVTVDEPNGTASFNIQLNTEPTADVTVSFDTDDTTACTVNPSTATFSSADWDTAQTITVTAVDDDAMNDPARSCTVLIDADTSTADTQYNGLNPDDIAVTVTDDDQPGFTVDPTALTLAESGSASSGEFTVRLNSQPATDVTIDVTPSDTNICTSDQTSLTFTNGDWNTPQIVTITAVDDAITNGASRTCTVVLSAPATPTDPAYESLDPEDVTITVTDDEVPGVTLSRTALTVTEGQPGVPVSVRLNTQPTGDVTIDLVPQNGECAVSLGTLTFSDTTWNVAQSVTVTATDDSSIEPTETCTITTSAASTLDTSYNGIAVPDITATVIDNDTPGVIVPASLTIAEPNLGGSFNVHLATQPTQTVTLALHSSDTTICTVPATVTIPSGSWQTGVLVPVTPVDDAFINAPARTCTVITDGATSPDGNYNNILGSEIGDVTVTVTDNDTAGVTLNKTALTVVEPTGSTTFTVVLSSRPTADVSFDISTSADCAASLSTLTIAPAAWNTPQSVTVQAVNDDIINAGGQRTCTVTTSPTTTSDTNFAGINPADVTVTVVDDDQATINVQPVDVTVSEPDTTTTFTVTLGSQPTGAVNVDLSSSDATACTVSPASVSLDAGSWQSGAQVTVTAVDNTVLDDPARTCTILTAAATSGDTNFAGVDPADVAVTVLDNEAAAVIIPTTALEISEPNGSATFTIQLGSQPTAPVTISLSRSDSSECSIGPIGSPITSVTLQPADWTGKTVLVRAEDDVLIDGPQTCTVLTGTTVSSDSAYNGLTVDNVVVTVNDNDTAGLVANTTALSVSEPNGATQFYIQPTTQLTEDVTIPLETDDPTVCTISPTNAVISTSQWASGVAVTVTAVDDDILNPGGARTCTVRSAGTSTSADTHYEGLSIGDITVTVLDNDAAQVIVEPTDITVFEPASSTTFTVRLASQPSGSVSIPLSTSPGAGVCTISQSSVEFNIGNWQAGLTVTVTAADNATVDAGGQRLCTVVTGDPSGEDANFAALGADDVDDVTVAVIDDETPQVIVSQTAITMSEHNATATFTVRVTSAPTSDVTIALNSSDTTSCTVSPASLTFSPSGGNSQTVTITSVDNAIDDQPNRSCTITTGNTSSTDPNYSDKVVSDVAVTLTDDDTAAFTVTPTTLNMPEGSLDQTFTVALGSRPANDVQVAVSSSDTALCTVSPANAIITPSGWQTAATFTVHVPDNDTFDGTRHCLLDVTRTSSDPVYNSLTIADVLAIVTDDETADILVAPTSLSLSEPSGSGSFTISLTSQPTADVTINLFSMDTTECTVSPSAVTLDDTTWTGASVTVTAVDDDIVDGTQTCTVQLQSAISADPNFNGDNPPQVSATVADNDAAGITVGAPTPATISESGTQATFTLALTSQPTAFVNIAVTSATPDECTVVSTSPAHLDATNWQTGVTVTVRGANDTEVDGTQTCTITTGDAASTDTTYNGMTVDNVTLSVTDNDTAGVVVDPTALAVDEGGVQSFNVRLTAQPTQPVTIALSTSNSECALDSGASPVTLTSSNWQTGVFVNVNGVDDDVVDGDQTCTVQTGAVTSGDTNFSGNPADVVVTVHDTDTTGTPGTISPAPTSLTIAEGGSASFNLVIGSAPTANVTVSLGLTGDTACSLGSVTSVQFTPTGPASQQVTIQVADDFISNPGGRTCTVVTGAATSTDGTYSGVDPANVTVTITDNEVAGGTDVQIDKTASTAAADAGDTVTYTLVVTNNGPADATNVSVTDMLPAGVTHVSNTPSTGTYTPGTGLWQIGSLTSGSSATLTIQTTVAASASGTVTNTATVTQDQTDSNANNNVDTAAFTAGSGGAALTITKQGIDMNGGALEEGDTIAWIICVTNPSASAVGGVVVTDTIDTAALDAPTTFSTGVLAACPSTAPVAGLTPQSNTQGAALSIPLPSIPGGQVGVVTFETTVASSGVTGIPPTDYTGLGFGLFLPLLGLGGINRRRAFRWLSLLIVLALFGGLLLAPDGRLFAQGGEEGDPSTPAPELPFTDPTAVPAEPTAVPPTVEPVEDAPTDVPPTSDAPAEEPPVADATDAPTEAPDLPTETPLPAATATVVVPPTVTPVSGQPTEIETWVGFELTEQTGTWAGFWAAYDWPQASQGTYLYSVEPDASLTYTFTGKGLRLAYLGAPNLGIFDLYIDEQLVDTIDAYDAEMVLKSSPDYPLALGAHTLRIQNTGQANEAAQGTMIALDALAVLQVLPGTPTPTATPSPTGTLPTVEETLAPGETAAPIDTAAPGTPLGLATFTPIPTATATITPTETPTIVPSPTLLPPLAEGWSRYQITSSTALADGAWEEIQSSFVSEGNYVYSQQDDAGITLAFEGDMFRLHYLLFWNFGFFQIYADEQLIATVDGYSAQSELLTSAEYSLAPGQHTIRIQNTGDANALSQGHIIALDAIDVRGTLVPPSSIVPTPTPTFDEWPQATAPATDPATEPATAEATEATTEPSGPTPTSTPFGSYEQTEGAGPAESGWTRYEVGGEAVQLDGIWAAIDSPTVSGGSYFYAEGTGASATLNFDGDGVRVSYLRYWNFGIFEITLDGVPVATLDGYNTEATDGLSDTFDVPAGPHTLRIQNTGQANAASAGTVLALDFIEIRTSGDDVTSTEAPAVDATAEATEEAAIEATADVTAEATADLTLEATAEVTAEVTPDATEALDLLQIGGTIWLDTDEDSRISKGDTPAAGTTVDLYADDGDVAFDPALDAAADSLVTGDDGQYLFDVTAGIYWIDLPDSANPAWEPLLVFAPGGENILEPVAAAAGPEAAPGDLVGLVFNDNDGNRQRDGDIESGIRNVEVYLYADDGDGVFDRTSDTEVAHTQVGPDGQYAFPGMEPGAYWVWLDESTLPANYMDTVSTGNHGIQNPSPLVIEAAPAAPDTATPVPALAATEEAEPTVLRIATAEPEDGGAPVEPQVLEGPSFAYAVDTDHDTSPDGVEGIGDRNDNGTPNYLDPFDPSGTVYVSATGDPAPNVSIRLVYYEDSTAILADTIQANPQLTGADGSYRFDITSGTTNGVPASGTREFVLELVEPLPAGYTFPSATYPPHTEAFDASPIVDSGQISTSTTPPTSAAAPHDFYMRFLIEAGDDAIVNNHIAVDSDLLAAAAVETVSNTACASLGGVDQGCATFNMALNSATSFTFTPVSQAMPVNAGASYTYLHTLTNTGTDPDQYIIDVVGSTAGWTQNVQISSGSTPLTTLTSGSVPYTTPSVPAGGTLSIAYTVTVPASSGSAVDSTSIVATSLTASNLSASVTDTTTAVPSAGGCVQGQVFSDENGNGVLDTGETVFSNTLIYIYNGGTLVTTATTDAQGFYNVASLPAGNYTIQVSQISLGGAIIFDPGTLIKTVTVNISGGCANGTMGLVIEDPAILKSASVNQAAPGEQVVFYITASNPYAATLDNVVIADPLNSMFVYASSTQSQGSSAYDATTNAVIFSLGSIAPGSSVSMSITVTIAGTAAPGSTINNVAQMTYTGGSVQTSAAAPVAIIARVTTLTATPTVIPTSTPTASTLTTSGGSSSYGSGSSGSGPSLLPSTGDQPHFDLALPVQQSDADSSSTHTVALALALVVLAACLMWGLLQLLAEYRSDRLAAILPRPGRIAVGAVALVGTIALVIVGVLLSGGDSNAPAEDPAAQEQAAQPTAPDYSAPEGTWADLPVAWEADQGASGADAARHFAAPDIPAERLIIPRIGIDTTLVDAPVVGTTWDVSTFTSEIAHLDGTAYAGTVGNAVFAGHIYHKTGPGPFRNLNQLEVGDLIVARGEGVEYTYAVSSVREVAPDEVNVTYPSNQPMITLLTCADWDSDEWTYGQRLVVRATFQSWRKTGEEQLTAPPTGSWTRTEVGDSGTKLSGDWERSLSEYTSSGDYYFSTDRDASVTLKFNGEKVRLHYLDYWNFGTFTVTIDGERVATIDSYSSVSRIEQSDIFFVEPGEHTLKIEATGKANASSEGHAVALDSIDVYAAK